MSCEEEKRSETSSVTSKKSSSSAKQYRKKVANPIAEDVVMKMEEDGDDIKDHSLRKKVVHFND